MIREALAHYLSAAETSPRIKPVGRSSDGGVAHRVDETLAKLGVGRK
jgi:hypothetical protein